MSTIERRMQSMRTGFALEECVAALIIISLLVIVSAWLGRCGWTYSTYKTVNIPSSGNTNTYAVVESIVTVRSNTTPSGYETGTSAPQRGTVRELAANMYIVTDVKFGVEGKQLELEPMPKDCRFPRILINEKDLASMGEKFTFIVSNPDDPNYGSSWKIFYKDIGKTCPPPPLQDKLSGQ